MTPRDLVFRKLLRWSGSTVLVLLAAPVSEGLSGRAEGGGGRYTVASCGQQAPQAYTARDAAAEVHYKHASGATGSAELSYHEGRIDPPSAAQEPATAYHELRAALFGSVQGGFEGKYGGLTVGVALDRRNFNSYRNASAGLDSKGTYVNVYPSARAWVGLGLEEHLYLAGRLFSGPLLNEAPGVALGLGGRGAWIDWEASAGTQGFDGALDLAFFKVVKPGVRFVFTSDKTQVNWAVLARLGVELP